MPPAPPLAPAIETVALGRRYGRRWALAELSFALPRGARAMLVGHNGSGKSTLLRVLGTALQPDRGSARISGFDVENERDEVRRRVALLGHRLYLYEALTALENLRIAARFLGQPLDRPRLLGELERVGLAERADDPVSSFSAGMRKRLALARTLLQPADLVLLDEPYGELDPAGFRLVDGLLLELSQKGHSVLIATHLVERGRETCTLALALRNGRLDYFGPVDELPAPAA